MRVIGVIVAAIAAWLVARRRPRRPLPPNTSIVVPPQSTVVAHDGAVKSVQSARLTLPRPEMERLWSPENLENLGRTYWQFLGRATLHLTRVVYTEDSRAVVFLIRPLKLLRFELPDYELEENHGRITWRVRDGLLVSRSRRRSGLLRLDVRDVTDSEAPQAAQTQASNGKAPAEIKGGQPLDTVTLEIRVEVENFYPSVASGFGTPFYTATQSFVHVQVAYAFLRSLARLQLAQSKVGKLRD